MNGRAAAAVSPPVIGAVVPSTIPAEILHAGGFEGPAGTSYISLDLHPQKPL